MCDGWRKLEPCHEDASTMTAHLEDQLEAEAVALFEPGVAEKFFKEHSWAMLAGVSLWVL